MAKRKNEKSYVDCPFWIVRADGLISDSAMTGEEAAKKLKSRTARWAHRGYSIERNPRFK